MCPETFLRVLGPKPYRVAYVQPSRRPADGRYGENPNRLYKHQQLQVILKPSPDDVLDQYLGSLEAIGIDLSKHDIKFEEDNWESPTLGAWGIGWQVMLDGWRSRSSLISSNAAASIWIWSRPKSPTGWSAWSRSCRASTASTTSSGRAGVKYPRRAPGRRAAVFGLQLRDGQRRAPVAAASPNTKPSARSCWRRYEKYPEKHRFPVLATYDQVLKCSHLFNLLDARGAISVTERVGVIKRVRDLAVGTAKFWAAQQEVA